MYCPNCNNFVDDNRDQCPFCNAQIHNIAHVNTPERRAMEKIVGSRLFVVMAVAFTLYTVFLAMSVILGVFSGAGFDIFNILLAIFGGILTWRIWTLYMGTVKKAPENPRAEKMTAFFTCQKVFSIILAVLLALVTLCMLVVVPYSEMIGNAVDKLMYEDGTVYDVIFEITGDEQEAKVAYDEFLISSGISEEELDEGVDEIRKAIEGEESLSFLFKEGSIGQLFKIAIFVLTVIMALVTVIFILLAVYMSKAVRFLNDFSITWNGYAPWRRGARYAAGLGYFLSVVVFIAALFSIASLPSDISLLINLSAAVALFCFSKFTVKIQNIMDELYRLNI